MRTTLVCSAFLVSVLVMLMGIQPLDARGSRKASKKKSVSSSNCRIVQDPDDQVYVLDCTEKKKKTRTKGRSKTETKSVDTSEPGISKKENVISDKAKDSEQSKGKCQCPRGKRGSRGRTGSKGTRGKTGRKGKTGLPGDDGRDGRPGVPGSRGPIGLSGKLGLPGPQGPKGIKGDLGGRGLKGDMGIPGSPGLPGNCIKKTNVGRVASPSFYCLPGKLGPQGPKGTRGLIGPKGAIGIVGPKGSKGESGPEGSRGRAGRPGSPGNLNNFLCSARYTSWIGISVWDTQFPDVHCDSREFLQGFRVETLVARKRYRYTCCKLTQ